MVTTSISENAAYLDCPDCLINRLRSDVGVLYFAGNDAQYAENPAGTKSSRNQSAKNVDSEIKVSPAGSNSIGD